MSALLSLVLSTVPAPAPPARVEGPIDFSSLSLRGAYAIEGESRTFRIWLSSAEWRIDGCPWYECWPASPQILRTAVFTPGFDAGEQSDFLVNGRLRVIKQEWGVELRVVESMVVRP
jgi:hypothetical protein